MSSRFKSVTRTLALVLAALILTACGGRAAAGPFWVLAQPSDRVVVEQGYASQIQPIVESDPVRSVARQASLGGNVILWIGGRSDEVVRNFPALIAEAVKYANFTHVYLYDELFWNGGTFQIEIGLHEDLVLQGARIAHAAGLKTVVTILPDVILDPRFALRDINALDAISIDVYPSIRISNDLHGCAVPGNLYEQLLACSVQKLRALGFRGQIGYIYQAFGVHTIGAQKTMAARRAALGLPVVVSPRAKLTAAPASEQDMASMLMLQRHAIDNAAALGADAVMPWGLYLGGPEIEREPFLYPLAGTGLEYLVRP